MTPNEGYQRRLGDWQKKERDREEARASDQPYDPGEMKPGIPIGCILLGISMLAGLAYFIYRLVQLKIL